MNKRLKDYLSHRGAKPLDANIIKKYQEAMVETTVPQIVEEIERSERIAAELRFMPKARQQGKKDN